MDNLLDSDKLNNIGDFEDFMDSYFGEMEISKEQVERRKEVARDIRDSLLALFLLVITTLKYDYGEYAFILTVLYDEIERIANDYTKSDEYVKDYIDKVANDIFAVTMLHTDPLDTEENFFLSDERASLIAVNEANSIINYAELQEAIKQGYKYKTWVTMNDRRVRKSHARIDGKTIPIMDYFEVGRCRLLMPRDEVNCTDGKEIVNCRCVLKYRREL